MNFNLNLRKLNILVFKINRTLNIYYICIYIYILNNNKIVKEMEIYFKFLKNESY